MSFWVMEAFGLTDGRRGDRRYRGGLKRGIHEGEISFVAFEEFFGQLTVGLGAGSPRVVFENGAPEAGGLAQADAAGMTVS